MIQCFRGWMKDSPKQMGSQSQPVLPMGSKIVQRWTAVPRAGHIGSEITHSVYGSLGVWRLTDLAIQQQTHQQTSRQTDRQADSWQCKVCHKVSHQPSLFRLQGASRETLCLACDANSVVTKTLWSQENEMCICSPMFTASSKTRLYAFYNNSELTKTAERRGNVKNSVRCCH